MKHDMEDDRDMPKKGGKMASRKGRKKKSRKGSRGAYRK